LLNSENVEADSLGERAALANCHNVAFLYSFEGGRAVSMHVFVSFLKPVVLADVVEVVSSDDNGSLHLGGDHNSPL